MSTKRQRAVVERRNGAILRRMTVYLPQKLAHRLRMLSEHQDKPQSTVIVEALDRALPRYIATPAVVAPANVRLGKPGSSKRRARSDG